MHNSKFSSLILAAYCLITPIIANAAEQPPSPAQEKQAIEIPKANEEMFKVLPPKVREEWIEMARMTPEELEKTIAFGKEAEKCLGTTLFAGMGGVGLMESCHMGEYGDTDINEPRIKEMLLINQPGIEKLEQCKDIMKKSKQQHGLRFTIAAREVYYKHQNSKMTFKQLCNEIKDF